VGDARAPFERLPGPFEPDQPKVVQPHVPAIRAPCLAARMMSRDTFSSSGVTPRQDLLSCALTWGSRSRAAFAPTASTLSGDRHSAHVAEVHWEGLRQAARVRVLGFLLQLGAIVLLMYLVLHFGGGDETLERIWATLSGLIRPS